MSELRRAWILRRAWLLQLYVLGKDTQPSLREIVPESITVGDHFGHRIAIADNLALISAIKGSDGAAEAGKAYLYDLSAGAFIAKLTPPDPAHQAFFGSSVALHGDRMLMTAPLDGGDYSGAAYLFAAPSASAPLATFIKKLRAPDSAAGAVFGISAAMGSVGALLGASQDSQAASASGAVYLFDASTGDFRHKLIAYDAAENDLFGYGVAAAEVDRGSVLVSAFAKDQYTGAAYMFDRRGVFVRKIVAPNAAPGQYFGQTLAVNGDRLLVGAPYDNSACAAGESGCGAAYLFDVKTGRLVMKLTSPTPTASSLFGNAVALSSSAIAIGSHKDKHHVQSGSVHLFDMEGTPIFDRLTSPSSSRLNIDNFAEHLALDAKHVFIGASGANRETGTVYVFDLPVDGTLDSTQVESGGVDNFGHEEL